jgi:hypothetical protein
MLFLVLLGALIGAAAAAGQEAIPLPEHPRPDFERPTWLNLNGPWAFRFDSTDVGLQAGWSRGEAGYAREILVPFSWGAPLSGVADEADIGWYARSVEIPAEWEGQRVFLVVGASDWHTTAWLDGHELGAHQGGYTPFSFELTPHLRPGAAQRLVLRVDDTDHAFKLFGKQGYGPARGIWQTPYLEVRGDAYLDDLHFTPNLDAGNCRTSFRRFPPGRMTSPSTYRCPMRGSGRSTIHFSTKSKPTSEARTGRPMWFGPTSGCGRSR